MWRRPENFFSAAAGGARGAVTRSRARCRRAGLPDTAAAEGREPSRPEGEGGKGGRVGEARLRQRAGACGDRWVPDRALPFSDGASDTRRRFPAQEMVKGSAQFSRRTGRR